MAPGALKRQATGETMTGKAVHHPRLGIGQVLSIDGLRAVVRFVTGTFEVPANSLGAVRAF